MYETIRNGWDEFVVFTLIAVIVYRGVKAYSAAFPIPGFVFKMMVNSFVGVAKIVIPPLLIISPIDLIPDPFLPFGFLDDFAYLIVWVYYLNGFRKIIKYAFFNLNFIPFLLLSVAAYVLWTAGENNNVFQFDGSLLWTMIKYSVAILLVVGGIYQLSGNIFKPTSTANIVPLKFKENPKNFLNKPDQKLENKVNAPPMFPRGPYGSNPQV